MSESQSQDDLQIKAEIQELLGEINNDLLKLKEEIKSVNNIVEENAALRLTMKMVNEKLTITAKNAGIDIENLGDIENLDDLGENENANGSRDLNEEEDESSIARSNADVLSAAADKLTDRIQNALK